MKRIGWVVRWTGPDFKGKWVEFHANIGISKPDAVRKFNSRCQFYFLKLPITNQYRRLRRRGLAYIAPVYVEDK